MKRFMLSAALLLVSIMAFSRPPGRDTSAVAEREWHIIDIFKPIYITSGIPLDTRPNADNSDVKFQLSLKISLVRDLWGKKFDFFVGYTQISVWNLYMHSSPFYDNTYIPGIYTAIPLKSKKTGAVNGRLMFGYEHRSNGRDDIWSRSVNYGFVTYTAFLPHNVTLQATGRIGDSYYGDTHTLLLYTKYLGYLQLSAGYVTPKKNFDFMLSVAPVINRSIANINAEIGYRLGRKHNNPYLFVQYHYGYDEAFRDCCTIVPDEMNAEGKVFYNGSSPIKPHHMLRFGILYSPGRATRNCL